MKLIIFLKVKVAAILEFFEILTAMAYCRVSENKFDYLANFERLPLQNGKMNNFLAF